jgi:hypothetical protein
MGQMDTRERRWMLGGVLLSVLGVLGSTMIGFLTNVLSGGSPPGFLKPLQGWLWPLLGLFTLTGVVVAAVSLVHSARGPGGGEHLVRYASNLVRRNVHFSGRADLLDQVRRTLAGERGVVALVARRDGAAPTQALYGMPGVGKTELALEYAHRQYEEGAYTIVWWILAEDPAQIPLQLATLCRRLGRPVPDGEDQVSGAFAELARRDRWLLVFDNVRAESDIAEFIPGTGRGHVIVTSRHQAWSPLTAPLSVDVFSPAEAREFLTKLLPETTPADADSLAEALGRLPLALDQAAAYLRRHPVTVSRFLELYAAEPLRVLDAGRAAGYPHSVLRTYALALAEVGRRSPAALQFLELCSFLAPDGIPENLPDFGADLLPNPLGTLAGDELARLEMIGLLADYSLINRRDGGFGVHRLIQKITRDAMPAERRERWLLCALEVLNRAGAAGGLPPQALLAHSEAVASHETAGSA